MNTHDADIRQALRKYLESQFGFSAKIIDEVNIKYGTVRADIMVLNEFLHGYEIKSDTDNLKRLHGQADAYSKVFDFNSIVCSPKYLDEVLELPSCWGIYLAKGETEGVTSIICYREPEINTNQDIFSMAQFLRKPEVESIFKELGVSKSFLRLPKYRLWEEVSNYFTLQSFKPKLMNILRARESWKFEGIVSRKAKVL